MRERPPGAKIERTAPNARSQPAARGSAASLLALQRTAGNRAVGALLARRQPRALARCGGGRCSCGGACRTDGLEDEEHDEHLGRARSARLQRSVSEWFDELGETISETVDATLESAKKKLETLADLTSFPLCPEELGTALPLPGLVDWFDNEGLEAVRNDGEILSRTEKPSVGDHGATRLVKQVLHAWGCQNLRRDLLPKHGSEGAFGPETQEAVKQFQLWAWLPVDGVVGPQTLAALDRHMGARPSSRVPEVIGGSDEEGKSNWSVFRSPAAHIYFKTDEWLLDADDERVLDAMAAEISSPRRGTKDITLEVVGYADKRDDFSYNVILAETRAQTVADYLYDLLKDSVNVAPPTVKAKGEIERPQTGDTEEELRPFRRVDVYVVEETFRERPPEPKCLEPTTEWEVQLRNMQTLGFGARVTTGRVNIRMKHPDSTGRRWLMTYRYAGGGGEIPIPVPGDIPLPSVSADSCFEEMTTSVPLAITEFAGSATYASAGVAAGRGWSIDKLTIDGIEHHGAAAETIVWKGAASGGAGIGAGADGWGRLVYDEPCEEITEPAASAGRCTP